MSLEIMAYDKEKGWHYRPIKETKMEFDKSRVYTALNADELRAGDKVIVANDITTLKKMVQACNPITLLKVRDECYQYRFEFGLGSGHSARSLAYLVERKENCTNCGEGRWDAEHQKILCDPVNCGNGNVVFRNHEIEVCEYWKPISKMPKTEQKAERHYRPFKNIDELVKVWVEKTKPYRANTRIPPLIMPLIWVREKDGIGVHLINGFTDDVVFVGKDYEDMDELFEAFTFLDGSPCGVEE